MRRRDDAPSARLQTFTGPELTSGESPGRRASMVAAGLMRALLVGLLIGVAPAWAQDKGSLNPVPLPPLPNPGDPATPAKQLFARKPEPAPLATRSIGFYARGCLAGAQALPVNGPTWQVMRLS